jgi:hypothetical protein
MAGGEARLAATDSGDPSNPEVSGGQPPGTGTELREARRQADQTRLEAESARQSALEQGADTLFASAFAALDDRLAAAVTALADGQVVAAAIGFAAVRSGYLDLSARRAEGPTDLEREGGNQSEVAEGDDSLAAGSAIPPGVSVEEPSSATTPEDAIRSLVNVYGDAFESEDLELLGRAVYRGALPEEDRAFLALLFESAERFEVAIEMEALTVTGDEAVALIRQAMKYQLSVTHETRAHEVPLRMVFERKDSAWRLVRLEQR